MKTNEQHAPAARLTDAQLATLDAYISLRKLEIEAVGVDATPLQELLASIRPAWHGDAAAHEIAAKHWATINANPQGFAALQTAVLELSIRRAV